ncbi:MAG: hypothetical protein QM770_09445 [Tepidisphaeraceae bacterium]
MVHVKRCGAMAVLAAAMLAGASNGKTVTLRDGLVDELGLYSSGYAGTSDTTIAYVASVPAYMRGNMGGLTTFRTRRGGTATRGLIRFDLSALSSLGLDVSSATLTLKQSNAVSNTLDVYPIATANAGWNEGIGKGGGGSLYDMTIPTVATANGDATWWYKSINVDSPNTLSTDPVGGNPLVSPNVDTGGTRWASGLAARQNPGSSEPFSQLYGGLLNPIDVVDGNPATVPAVPTSAPAINSSGQYANLEPTVSVTLGSATGTATAITLPNSLVTNWITTPADNAGLLLVVESSAVANTDYYSSENATAANRPTLVLNLTKKGDFNDDLLRDTADIDLLFTAPQGPATGSEIYDVNADGQIVTSPGAAGSDTDAWVHTLQHTEYGDTDLDGHVNFSDLLVLASNYNTLTGAGWAMGSFNGDGAVNFNDLLVLAANYNFSSSPTGTFAGDWALAQAQTPEPASLVLGLSVALPMLRRRR